ncbi:NAD(P)/FAD-dependent oxidoreductase [Acidipila sp. EB88]|uniref:NAD(P)/FAD-dependent oxidoreductase n=1 Tax=Acidipila sp. EB88 TaxID=2305226 RepID=UPI0035143B01
MVLGAGAAGLFCTGLLVKQGLRVLVVDHAPEAGRKILISGGGRANFTNLNTGPENFLSENPHFAKSALARYTPHQFVELVDRYGIGHHAKAPGQLFCDGSARQLVSMLLAEAEGAELSLQTTVRQVTQTADGFLVRLLRTGTEFIVATTHLVIATGGLSIPKLGATGLGYDLARQFGLSVVPTRAALVPLTFDAEDAAHFEGLSGVAAETEVTISVQQGKKRPETTTFRDKLLITHRGLSGPSILQISSYWRPGYTLNIDLAPNQLVTAPLLRANARRDEGAALAAWAAVLPRRLAERLLRLAPPAAWTNDALMAAEHRLHQWPVTPGGTEGYAKAEVTAGGISTRDLHAQTLEARRVPGLYCIGEVVDVTGHLGGYNFQWAWASAAAAASSIAAPGKSPESSKRLAQPRLVS